MLLVAAVEHRAAGVEVERRGQLPGRLPAGLYTFGDRTGSRAARVRDPKPRDGGKPAVRWRGARDRRDAHATCRCHRDSAARASSEQDENRKPRSGDKQLDDKLVDSRAVSP